VLWPHHPSVLSLLVHSTLDPKVDSLTPYPTHETYPLLTICPLQVLKHTPYR
jgi:hypothetical protein